LISRGGAGGSRDGKKFVYMRLMVRALLPARAPLHPPPHTAASTASVATASYPFAATSATRQSHDTLSNTVNIVSLTRPYRCGTGLYMTNTQREGGV